MQTSKGSRVIDNWYIPKLELLQSVTSKIHENGAAVQWSADATEQCHVTEIKELAHSSNNQEYESQICHFLDCADKCQWFDIATAICEAHINFCSLTDDPGLESDGDDDRLCENPGEDPLSTISTTEALLTCIWPAAPVAGTI